jgi:Histidine kinase
MSTDTNSRAYWLCQCAGWGLYTATRLYAAVTLVHLPWAQATLELLLLDGTALGLTHGLRAFMRRHRWSAQSVRRKVPRILVASFVLAVPLGLMTLGTSVSALQDPAPLFDAFAPELFARFTQPILLALHIVNWALTFALWLTIYFTVISQRQRRLAELHQSELARALQLAELRVLKTQLNPHFLFNSLNTVRSLIADDPARAQRAVTHLANTLRYTLSAGNDELVSLAQELDIVREYLALETMRFEDRLSVAFHVAPGTGDVRIPVMLLQTVVENAIKHGIAELPEGGTINISAELADGALLMRVENPRPKGKTSAAGDGIGLRNADERLRLLFGAGASLDLDLSNPSVATARIRIPRPT